MYTIVKLVDGAKAYQGKIIGSTEKPHPKILLISKKQTYSFMGTVDGVPNYSCTGTLKKIDGETLTTHFMLGDLERSHIDS